MFPLLIFHIISSVTSRVVEAPLRLLCLSITGSSFRKMLSWRKLNQPSRWVLLLLFGVVFLSSLLVDEIQGLSSSLPSSCTAATTTATAPPPPTTNNQSPCLLRSRRQLLQETWNNGVGMFVGSAILGVGVTTITPSRAEAAPPYVTLRFCFEAYYIPPPILLFVLGPILI